MDMIASVIHSVAIVSAVKLSDIGSIWRILFTYALCEPLVYW